MIKVLLIEDDQSVSELVKFNLEDNGYQVHAINNGRDGLKAAMTEKFDLMILDILVPGVSGLEICKSVQNLTDPPPILFLSSRSQEIDRVIGLEMGADDYIVKPFGIRELIARVKAALRRKNSSNSKESSTPIRFGELSIDKAKRTAFLNEKELELTPTEFDLLYYLVSHPGRAFTREELLNDVWGYSYAGYEHTVNSHINRLRNKIEKDPANPTIIETVWGIGYRCVESL